MLVLGPARGLRRLPAVRGWDVRERQRGDEPHIRGGRGRRRGGPGAASPVRRRHRRRRGRLRRQDGAARRGGQRARRDTVALLCRAGADVNAADRWGGRPLDDAAFGGHRDCVDVLLGHGAGYGKAQQSVEREALSDLFEQYAQVRDGRSDMTLDWEDVKALLQGIGQEPKDWHVKNLFRIG